MRRDPCRLAKAVDAGRSSIARRAATADRTGLVRLAAAQTAGGRAMSKETKKQPTCVVVSPGETYRGRQELDLFTGISAESAGATGVCMHLLTIPPGARSKPHLHERHETVVYVLEGEGGLYRGNVPNLTDNVSPTNPCRALVARTDPNEQESVRAYDGGPRGS
jgi:uncharacterized RmlC-like cupin family protein